jgi:hypothetical protein
MCFGKNWPEFPNPQHAVLKRASFVFVVQCLALLFFFATNKIATNTFISHKINTGSN